VAGGREGDVQGLKVQQQEVEVGAGEVVGVVGVGAEEEGGCREAGISSTRMSRVGIRGQEGGPSRLQQEVAVQGVGGAADDIS
jgi:hypothetical protein